MTRIYRELTEEAATLKSDLYSTKTEKKHFGKITVFSGENKRTGKTYYTISSAADLFRNSEQKEHLRIELARALGSLFDKYSFCPSSKVMVVGLGNEKITADSLGARVADKLTVTGHLYSGNEGIRARFGNLCALKSSVGGVTGIESFDLISAAAKIAKPDLIVAVDTLSCGKTERLGNTIQLTDNGIEPGGGVNNPKKKLSLVTLKTPVIAVGVPFVIYVRTILSEFGAEKCPAETGSLVVTAKDVDFLVEDYSDVIASALDEVVHSRPMSLI